jgi:hypothetical protein
VFLEIVRESTEDLVQRPRLHKSAEATVTSRVGRVGLRQILPPRTGAENPENAVEGLSVIAPRPAPTIPAARERRKERLDESPLVIREVHAFADGRQEAGLPIYETGSIKNSVALTNITISSVSTLSAFFPI